MAWHFDFDLDWNLKFDQLNGFTERWRCPLLKKVCWTRNSTWSPFNSNAPLSRAQPISIQENELIEPDLKFPQGTVTLRRWGSTIYLENLFFFFLMFNMGRLSWSEDDMNIKMESWWEKKGEL